MKNNGVYNNINHFGIHIIKNLYSTSLINDIRNKVINALNNKSNYLPIKNIAAYKKNSKLLLGPNGKLKKNIKSFEIAKGLEYITKKTNSISIKDPLITIPELNKLVFSEKSLNIASKVFKSNNFKLGYIKLGVFFGNKLPKNCINYFHTDDLKFNLKKKINVCKISISLNIKKTSLSEFGILPIPKQKNIIKKQYFSINQLDKNYANKIIFPKISPGDGILFDPMNFFHVAKKPKEKMRIIFYIEFLRKNNSKIFNKVVISKKYLESLPSQKRKIASNFQAI